MTDDEPARDEAGDDGADGGGSDRAGDPTDANDGGSATDADDGGSATDADDGGSATDADDGGSATDAAGGGDVTDVAEGRTDDVDGGGDDATRTVPDDLTDLRFVGPATAAALSAADVDPADVVAKRVTYRNLLDAGVNPGVAARIRREHSLSWSFESDADDLGARSSQVRGLGDDERAWVAASSGDWESADPESAADPAETDGSGAAEAGEAAWRARSAPTPVTVLDAVGDADADRLSRGGINSVRSLAAADPESVADALELDEARVRAWVEAAAAHED